MKKLLMICASLLVSSLVLPSCISTKTVIPEVIQDTKPSFDGNKQDSGLISVSESGAIVTQKFIERYDAMIGIYGDELDFLPPLKPGEGVSEAPKEEQEKNSSRGQVYLMSREALVNFIKMNQWRKAGREPVIKKSESVASRVFNAFK